MTAARTSKSFSFSIFVSWVVVAVSWVSPHSAIARSLTPRSRSFRSFRMSFAVRTGSSSANAGWSGRVSRTSRVSKAVVRIMMPPENRPFD